MRFPKYRLHKPSGRAVIQFRPLYGANPIYLPGAFGSRESKAAFAQKCEEIAAYYRSLNDTPEPRRKRRTLLAILASKFYDWAKDYYGKNGETAAVKSMVTPFLDDDLRWAAMPADDFGPVELKAVREWFLAQKVRGENPTRGYVNHQVNRVRRMFRWGSEHEMVDGGVWMNLKAVPALRKGKTTAREPNKILPIEFRFVEATLPFMPPVIRAMVMVQWLTGMRADEVHGMRGEFIARDGDVWIYEPPEHKTAYAGKRKIICLGPRAQEHLKPYLKDSGPLFSPSIAMAERSTRRVRADLRDTYTTDAYGRAIFYALKQSAKAGLLIPPWRSHRLRHSRGTATRETYGIEGAQAQLGNTLEATEIYAEKSVQLAIKIARETG